MVQIVAILAAGFVMIGLMLGYYSLQKKKLEKERSILLFQQNVLREQYEQLENVLNISRKYREEISGLLEHGLTGNEDIPEITEDDFRAGKMEDDVTICCENPLIREVLRHKALECRQNKINYSFEIQGIERLNIKDIDLIGILYNLFDNAIEACRRIPVSENRYIRAETECIKRTWHLKVNNSCLSDSNAGVNRRNPEDHGIGLTIIKDLARENRGRFHAEQTGTEFQADVWLPAKKERTR